MENGGKYWFPVRRYGWGWGLPTSWQGWLVLAAYAASLAILFFLLPPETNQGSFAAGVLLASALFVFACWLKGEPPRWRWGGK